MEKENLKKVKAGSNIFDSPYKQKCPVSLLKSRHNFLLYVYYPDFQTHKSQAHFSLFPWGISYQILDIINKVLPVREKSRNLKIIFRLIATFKTSTGPINTIF